MTNETLLFYLITAVFILAVSLIGLILAYLPLLRWITKQKSAERELSSSTQTEVEKVLSKAHDEAAEIVQKAQNQAEGIVRETKFVSNSANQILEKSLAEINSNLQAQLSKSTQEYLREYQDKLYASQSAVTDHLQSLTTQARDSTFRSAEEMKAILAKEVAQTREQLVQRLQIGMDQIDSEVDTIRQAKLRKLDDQIFEIIREVSTLVLGRGLDFRDQAELVTGALSEVKKNLNEGKSQ